MGETYIPKEVFVEFLNDISSRYTYVYINKFLIIIIVIIKC